MDSGQSDPDNDGNLSWQHIAASIRKNHPVDNLIWYSNNCALAKRKGGKDAPPPSERGDRKPIKNLSAKSRMRLAFIMLATKTVFNSLSTLTYHNQWPANGVELKADLNRFLTQFRRRFYGDYLWFLEFQTRDAPHFHLMLEMAYSRGRHNLLTDLWLTATGNVSDGAMRRVHNHEAAYEPTRSADGAIRYAVKYATKPSQKQVPKDFQDVGRFWGVSGGVLATIAPIGELTVTEQTAQAILEAFDHPAKKWGIVPKVLLNIPNLTSVKDV